MGALANIRRQWRRRLLRELRHAIERPVENLQFYQNEVLQIGISLPAAGPMGLEDNARDAVDDRFGNGPRDFSRQYSEILASHRAKGNRVIAVVVNTVAGPDLAILAVAAECSLVLVAGGGTKLRVLRA
jgi:hypothetical protein